MSTILYILLALVVLLVLITVHEFGHYCAGKILGFKINEFSIGFGPAIYKKVKKNGEIFAIRALPLGGFCAFEGEDEDENEDNENKDNAEKDNPENKNKMDYAVAGASVDQIQQPDDQPASQASKVKKDENVSELKVAKKAEFFNSKPAWKRLIVLLSGVFFNFLFGILTAAIYLMSSGYTVTQVTNYVTQSGIEALNFQKGDIIIAVNGKSVEAYRSFTSMIEDFETEEFIVTVERDGETIEITAKKQYLSAFYYVSYETYFEGKLFQIDPDTKQVVSLSVEDFVDAIISIDTSSETEESEKGKGGALYAYLSTVYKTAENAGDPEYSYANDIDLLLSGDEDNGIPVIIAYSDAGLGVGIIQTYVQRSYSFFECLYKAWPFCFYLCKLILVSLAGLFTGAVSVAEAGGTITAISQIAEISQWGINYFLLLLPMLSMNLALFNILPIPALDGARAVFVLIEMIFRKPVPRKIEAIIHTVGLFALLALVIFLDINHFFFAWSFLLTS